MASWGHNGRRLTVVLNDNAPWYRGAWRWVAVCIIVAGALVIGGRAFAQSPTTGYTRCAVVDVRANKVVMIRQGNGDTIIRVVAYVDNGDNIEYEAHVWRFARRLVTTMHGTTLRERCVK